MNSVKEEKHFPNNIDDCHNDIARMVNKCSGCITIFRVVCVCVCVRACVCVICTFLWWDALSLAKETHSSLLAMVAGNCCLRAPKPTRIIIIIIVYLYSSTGNFYHALQTLGFYEHINVKNTFLFNWKNPKSLFSWNQWDLLLSLFLLDSNWSKNSALCLKVKCHIFLKSIFSLWNHAQVYKLSYPQGKCNSQ